MKRRPVAENPKYTIRNIDPAVWKAVKDRAASEDRQIARVLRAFLRVYAKVGYRVIETFDGKNHKS